MLRGAVAIITVTVGLAVVFFWVVSPHEVAHRTDPGDRANGPSQRIVVAPMQGGGAMAAPSPGGGAPTDNGPPDPELMQLASHLDDVCGTGGDIVETLARIEAKAHTLSGDLAALILRLRNPRARSLLLLVLARVDPSSFSRARSAIGQDAPLMIHLAAYWGLAIDHAPVDEPLPTRVEEWKEIFGVFILLNASGADRQHIFLLRQNSAGEQQIPMRHVVPTDDPAGLRALISGMQTSSEETLRNLCALLLVPSRANPVVREAFREVLARDASAEVRDTAASFLSGDPSAETRASLRLALETDTDEKVRATAAYTLAAQADEPTLTYLIGRFHSTTSHLEKGALISGLSESSCPGSTAFLVSVVRMEGETCLQSDALHALAKRGNDDAAVPAMVDALSSDNLFVRTVAARALGKTGALSAIAPLRRAADSDPDKWVRKLAQESIDEITKAPTREK